MSSCKRTNEDFDIHVAGGQEQLRMLREIVDRDGNKTAGAGFDVKKVAGKSGVYEITFNPAFSSTPAASANQIALGEDSYTTDNALIVDPSAGRMRVKTGTRYGDEGSAGVHLPCHRAAVIRDGF